MQKVKQKKIEKVPKKFIDVNDAYSALSDPKKKRIYDQGVDPLNPEEASSREMHFGRDASETVKMFFEGGLR